MPNADDDLADHPAILDPIQRKITISQKLTRFHKKKKNQQEKEYYHHQKIL